MNRSKLIGIIGFVLVLGLILGITLEGIINPNPIESLKDSGEVADFTLPSVNGDNYTLSEGKGKVIALTFLYSHCQMGCASVSANMAAVRDKLVENEQMQDVIFVTVSFDWRYDNYTTMKNYSSFYTDDTENEWQFLFGNQQQIEEVTNSYNFYFELDNSTMDDNSTMMMTGPVYNHSFIVYVIDQNMHLRDQVLGSDFEIDELYYPIDFLLNE